MLFFPLDRDMLVRVIQSLENSNQGGGHLPTSKNHHVTIRPKSAIPTRSKTTPSTTVRQRPKSSCPTGRLTNHGATTNSVSYISTWIGPTWMKCHRQLRFYRSDTEVARRSDFKWIWDYSSLSWLSLTRYLRLILCQKFDRFFPITTIWRLVLFLL